MKIDGVVVKCLFLFRLLQEEEKERAAMEMTNGVDPSANAGPPPSYGTDAGYSEDYGMKETSLQTAQDDYVGVADSNNGSAAAAAGPSNPFTNKQYEQQTSCLLYTSPSPRDRQKSRMPSSA